MKIVIIGAGRVATHLALALQQSIHQVVQVVSRTTSSAQHLARQVGCTFTTDLSQVTSADAYIISTTDTAVATIAKQLSSQINDGVVLHTAGSLDQEVLLSAGQHVGVLYPFQTFSLERIVDFKQVPLMLSWTTPHAQSIIEALAQALGGPTYILTDTQRRYLHMAAVFACNFTNHCYKLAHEVLGKADLPYTLLHPLIIETAEKACQMLPQEAQTGPAIRGDQGVLDKHLALLQDTPNLKDIYQRISDSIQNSHKQ